MRLRQARWALFQWMTFACCLACAAPRLIAQKNVGERYLFHALNASRLNARLPPLAWNEELAHAAVQHLEIMRKEGTLTHQLAGEAGLPERVAAIGVRFTLLSENIGMAQSAAEIHSLWMGSPDHRDNMLDPTITSVGIAVFGSGNDVWAVEDFAHTVPELSLSQQEFEITQLLRSVGVPAAGSDAARNMCSLESGYVGKRPAFVMRFQSADLTQLPQSLLLRLQRGKVSVAAVGACTQPEKKFAPFRIAIALYP